MYDVVIVGAGPAGSIAAAILARHGSQVLLLDKKDFPRHKVCGDGIGWSTIKLLSEVGLSLETATDELYECDKVRGISPSGYIFEGPFPQREGHSQHGYVIPRQHFDHILWQFALEQGAQFERFHVTEPIIEDGVVRGVRGDVAGKTAERRARITFAADGAKSVIARALHPDKIADKHYAVAIRGYFEDVQDLDRSVEFYFNQTVLPGYGWVFPLGEGRANIGVGLRLDVIRQKKSSLRQAFETFIRDPRVAAKLVKARPLDEPRGWVLPLGSQRLQRAYAGALLIGDAGAFISPLSGGGIYNALETGRIAAHVALEALDGDGGSLAELRKYEVRWRKVLGRKLRSETLVQKLLSWPGMLDWVIRNMHRNEWFAHQVLDRL
ncbi:MAG: NAD(P)/FAD-dependent oxidoreductase [Chloroflexi bacterium]|nr:NAD(P)/FAD-dependent oxidoreductase [Chloroflexota bacterium]